MEFINAVKNNVYFFVCLFIYLFIGLFVCDLTSCVRIFCSCEGVTIAGKDLLQNFGLCSASTTFLCRVIHVPAVTQDLGFVVLIRRTVQMELSSMASKGYRRPVLTLIENVTIIKKKTKTGSLGEYLERSYRILI